MPHTRRRSLGATAGTTIVVVAWAMLAFAPGKGGDAADASPWMPASGITGDPGTQAATSAAHQQPVLRGAPAVLAPMQLPAQEPRIRVGRYLAVPRPIHIRPGAGERPVVRSLLNMYQLDQDFADLFSPEGRSNICGAASVANGLVYVRHNRRPAFPLVMQRSVPTGSTNADAVRAAYKKCRVDPKRGTTSENLVTCARSFVDEGGYRTDWIWRVGIHADPGRQHRAPQPTELREYINRDRAVVLLFGWYAVQWDAETKKWTYVRNGGHFVALAGYDAGELSRIYVSNPLVDYNAPGFGEVRESAVRLLPVSLAASVAPPGGVRGLWQTGDLIGGGLAVLEEAVVIGVR